VYVPGQQEWSWSTTKGTSVRLQPLQPPMHISWYWSGVTLYYANRVPSGVPRLQSRQKMVSDRCSRPPFLRFRGTVTPQTRHGSSFGLDRPVRLAMPWQDSEQYFLLLISPTSSSQTTHLPPASAQVQ
jgi:hypothetical protein